jgi:hypothetical protein
MLKRTFSFSLLFMVFILPLSVGVHGLCIDKRFVANEQLEKVLVEKISKEYPEEFSVVDQSKILFTIMVEKVNSQERVAEVHFRIPAMCNGRLMVEYYVRMIPAKETRQVLDVVQLLCYSDSFELDSFNWSPFGRGWYGGLYDMPGMYKEYTDIDENKPFAFLLPDDDDNEEKVGNLSWADIGMRIVEVKLGEKVLVNVCWKGVW